MQQSASLSLRFEVAVAAADNGVACTESAYGAGTITLDVLLASFRNQAEAKRKLGGRIQQKAFMGFMGSRT